MTFFTFPFWVLRVDFGYLRREIYTSKQEKLAVKPTDTTPAVQSVSPEWVLGRGRLRVWAHRKSRTVLCCGNSGGSGDSAGLC